MRKQIVTELANNPLIIAHKVGFSKLGALHNTWMQNMLLSKTDETLLGHRNSYKTTCLSVAIAEIIVFEPYKNILFLRKTDDDVKEIVEQVKRILESEFIQNLVIALYGHPLVIRKSNVTEIDTNLNRNTRGAVQLLGMGTAGSLTGKHADVIITDDIVNLKDRVSQAERERTKSVYRELQNIKNVGGRIFNTGTPWHKDDAISLMPNVKRYTWQDTGIISSTEIEELRSKMTPSLFAANYELQHIAAENSLFNIPPKFTADESKLYNGFAHIDARYSGEDGTAFTCGCRDGDTLYMFGKLWQAHVDTKIQAIKAYCEQFRCSPIYTEENADKGYLARDLRNLGMASKTYHESVNKYIKISSYLYKWWGKIVWIDGTDSEYLNQIMDYTEDAAHDDAPDSAACMARLLDKKSFRLV